MKGFVESGSRERWQPSSVNADLEDHSDTLSSSLADALAQCSANGFTLNVDTSHLPNESNTTFTTNSTSTENFNLTQITQLAECTSECTSVCSLEDAINFNS